MIQQFDTVNLPKDSFFFFEKRGEGGGRGDLSGVFGNCGTVLAQEKNMCNTDCLNLASSRLSIGGGKRKQRQAEAKKQASQGERAGKRGVWGSHASSLSIPPPPPPIFLARPQLVVQPH